MRAKIKIRRSEEEPYVNKKHIVIERKPEPIEENTTIQYFGDSTRFLNLGT